MSEKRYREDTGCIIDNQEGVLSIRQVKNRLNKHYDETIKLKSDQRIIGETLDETILERDRLIEENKYLSNKRGELETKNILLRNENAQLKDDAKIVLLILQSIGKLPFNISIGEAKAIKRLSENIGELFNGEGI